MYVNSYQLYKIGRYIIIESGPEVLEENKRLITTKR
jgi:hypothetical protein